MIVYWLTTELAYEPPETELFTTMKARNDAVAKHIRGAISPSSASYDNADQLTHDELDDLFDEGDHELCYWTDEQDLTFEGALDTPMML